MFSSKWCILCWCVIRNDGGSRECFKVYKIGQKQSINGVLNHVGHAIGDILLCYEYMNEVVESLYKEKFCYKESWVVNFLLCFLALYSNLRDNLGHSHHLKSCASIMVV